MIARAATASDAERMSNKVQLEGPPKTFQVRLDEARAKLARQQAALAERDRMELAPA